MRKDVELVSEEEIARFIVNRVNSDLRELGDGEEMKSISIYRLRDTDPSDGSNWSVGYGTSIRDLEIIKAAVSAAKRKYDLKPV